MRFCLSCHDYGAKYAEHTRHAENTALRCFDCHVQKKLEIMNVPTTKDIHSPDYFMVHEDNCYDPDLVPACLGCHAKEGEEWAQTWVGRWGEPDQAARTEH